MVEVALSVHHSPSFRASFTSGFGSWSWSSSNVAITKTWKSRASASVSIAGSSSSDKQAGGQQLLFRKRNNCEKKERVFFLDVNAVCYAGSRPSLRSFGYWLSLFFSDVSNCDPVIAVLDGERGNESRRQLLPSYKANRRIPASQWFPRNHAGNSRHIIIDVLQKCNVPVVKIKGYEADDVVATLVEQVLGKGYRVVIGSPDKDFKQLISEDVQIVMPIPELGRWSFYTLKHYVAQYKCHPGSDLSLRCIIGDEADGVPGLQHVAPGFGHKTALKLLKKHGSLEDLLNTAAVRTVGKQYVQDALTKHADYLRRNYKLLSLRRDVDVSLQDEWLSMRDTRNDAIVLSNFFELLGGGENPK